MSDYRFMKLLKDKKLADSYQYFEASEYKIYLAELSYSAIEKVIAQYQETERNYAEKVFSDVRKAGVGSYKIHPNYVEYFGMQVSPTTMMDKLTMEIMSLLHNFFDTFAQWINASLFAEDGVPMEKVSLKKVIDKIPEFTEYSGEFITMISNLTTSPEVEYIADFNNTLKHRRQIYVDNHFDVLSFKGSVDVPEFSKDGRSHVKEDTLTVLREKIDFCTNLLKLSKEYIEAYYAHNDNWHVKHRFENPKTYMFFESKEDYEAMKFPKNHYYYIEVDPSNVLDEYHFILCCDRMDGTPYENIEFYNIPYPIIMLRVAGTEKIIGILKPIDGENRSIRDARELSYRKYSTILTDYEREMSVSMCLDDNFHYYPYLSCLTGGYALKEGEEEMTQDI